MSKISNNREKAIILIEQIKEDIVSTVSTIQQKREEAKLKINTNSIIYNMFSNRQKYKFSSSVFEEVMNILYTKN